MDILLIYQFCSFGGVERAILNRVMTFRKYHCDVKISVGYLHDYGALQSFQAYIHANNLDKYLSAFLISEKSFLDLDKYDLLFNIDTPQVLEKMQYKRNVIVECHTPIRENRKYLRTLPGNIHQIIVPSEAFKAILVKEYPNLPPIFVLPNPVSDEFFNIPFLERQEIYKKKPIAYLARLDKSKNFTEAMRIFELFDNDENVMFAIVGKGAEQISLINVLERKRILDKTFLRDQIDFGAIPTFVKMIRDHQGIFISPSRGESFGLSAAEFVSAGVPVLLSDIAPHKELVNGDEKFLYSLGDIVSAKRKIISILGQWKEFSEIMISYREKLRGDSFINAWRMFLDSQK